MVQKIVDFNMDAFTVQFLFTNISWIPNKHKMWSIFKIDFSVDIIREIFLIERRKIIAITIFYCQQQLYEERELLIRSIVIF